MQCVPEKGRMMVAENMKNELVPHRPLTRLCMCIDYKKLNKWTLKVHFTMSFMDYMFDMLARKV